MAKKWLFHNALAGTRYETSFFSLFPNGLPIAYSLMSKIILFHNAQNNAFLSQNFHLKKLSLDNTNKTVMEMQKIICFITAIFCTVCNIINIIMSVLFGILKMQKKMLLQNVNISTFCNVSSI